MEQEEIKPFRGLEYTGRLMLLMGLFLFSMIIIELSGSKILSIIFGIELTQENSIFKHLTDPNYLNASIFLQVIYQLIAFLLPALLFAQIYKKNEMYEYLGFKKNYIFLLAFLGGTIFLALGPFSEVLYNFVKSAIQQPLLDQADSQSDAYSKALLSGNSYLDLFQNLFLMAVLPAICEELYFRGALQGLFQEWTGNRHIAVWVAGFIFAFFHISVYKLIPIALMGVLLGYIYSWTNNILYNITAHFLNNGLMVLGFWLNENQISISFLNGESSYTLIEGITSIAISAGLIYLFYILSKKYIKTNLTEPEKLKE